MSLAAFRMRLEPDASLFYAFPVDGRAIARREDLGLSEGRVRRGLAALIEAGFPAR